MPVSEVEAWLDQFPQKRAENKPNGGIVQSIADTKELYLRPMSTSERKVAVAKAQREHRQALKNLAKQEAADAKEIAKQLAIWRKEDKKEPTAEELAAKKEARRLKRNELVPADQKILDILNEKGFYEVKDFEMSKVYLQKIIRKLRRLGHRIEPVRQNKEIARYVLSGQ